MGDINKAVAWAIQIANDPTHGYDQAHRQGPDYDCSSFVSNALAEGGYSINRGNTTRTLYKALHNIGYRDIDLNSTRQKGDILLKVGHHVVMCINSSQIVHASINEKGTTTGGKTGDQTGKEICIRNYYRYSGGWDYLLRIDDTVNPMANEWIYSEESLSQSEMENNAIIVYEYLSNLGYNINTISAILGNMQAESTINPHRYEGGVGPGYGLVQWTPQSVLIEHASNLGLSDYTNGDIQLQVIDSEINGTSGNNEWYTTSAFITNYFQSGATTDMIGITPQQFITNEMNWGADKLAIMFMAGYERPSYDPDVNHYLLRQQYALYWLAFLGDLPPIVDKQKRKNDFIVIIGLMKRRGLF